MKKNISIKKISGFTLVEMLVALAVFVVVIAIVGGIYMTFVQKQRDQLGMQTVQQDVQNFFDTLEREVRTGYGDTFPFNPLAFEPNHYVEFHNQENFTVRYDLENNKIVRTVNNSAQKAITSDRTYVKELKVYVPSLSIQSTDGDYRYLTGMPTRVTVLVKACTDASAVSCVTTQTSLSVRQFKPAPTPTPAP